MNEKKYIKIVDKNGKEIEYEILCAFEMAETEKNYVVYTDNTEDEEGNLNVFAAIYDPEDDTKFEEIKTEKEWEAVEAMLETISNQ